MTLQTIKRAGFLILDDPDELDTTSVRNRGKVRPYQAALARCGLIIARLGAIRDGYFQGDPAKTVKIPVDVPVRAYCHCLDL